MRRRCLYVGYIGTMRVQCILSICSIMSSLAKILCLLSFKFLLGDSFAEGIDCQVYNNLYVCMEGSRLDSVAFVDVNAVQTMDDIELHLENLGITEITDTAFDKVKNASSLYLRDNKLSKIPINFCQFMDQLTFLDLCNNSITEIEDGGLAKLHSLETLLLDYNSLTNFQPGTWRGLFNLHELYLTNNTVSLKKNMFKGLKHLETLALDANGISRIPVGTFNGVPHLDLLYLSRNMLSNLNADVFRNLGEVNELDLGRNYISVLPTGIFKHLRNLDSLWLNGNRLKTLEAGAFQGLEKLSSLFLNSNDFDSVELAMFARMKNVSIEPGFRVGGTVIRNFDTFKGRFRCSSSDYQEPYNCEIIEAK